jgi:hypothetical protein
VFLYDANRQCIAADDESARALGYPSAQAFLEEVGDVAKLFIEKPGYVYNFRNFSWIDFVIFNPTREHKVLIPTSIGEIDTILSVRRLKDRGSNDLYAVVLKDIDNLDVSSTFIYEGDRTFEIDESELKMAQEAEEPRSIDTPALEMVEQGRGADLYEEGGGSISQLITQSHSSHPSMEHGGDGDEVVALELVDSITQEESGSETMAYESSVAQKVAAKEDNKEVGGGMESKRTTAQKNRAYDGPRATYDLAAVAQELEIDEDLIQELLEDFLHQAREIEPSIYEALETKNLRKLKDLIHKIKGAVANLRIKGADEILVQTSNVEDFERLGEITDQFYAYLAKLEEYLYHQYGIGEPPQHSPETEEPLTLKLDESTTETEEPAEDPLTLKLDESTEESTEGISLQLDESTSEEPQEEPLTLKLDESTSEEPQEEPLTLKLDESTTETEEPAEEPLTLKLDESTAEEPQEEPLTLKLDETAEKSTEESATTEETTEDPLTLKLDESTEESTEGISLQLDESTSEEPQEEPLTLKLDESTAESTEESATTEETTEEPLTLKLDESTAEEPQEEPLTLKLDETAEKSTEESATTEETTEDPLTLKLDESTSEEPQEEPLTLKLDETAEKSQRQSQKSTPKPARSLDKSQQKVLAQKDQEVEQSKDRQSQANAQSRVQGSGTKDSDDALKDFDPKEMEKYYIHLRRLEQYLYEQFGIGEPPSKEFIKAEKKRKEDEAAAKAEKEVPAPTPSVRQKQAGDEGREPQKVEVSIEINIEVIIQRAVKELGISKEDVERFVRDYIFYAINLRPLIELLRKNGSVKELRDIMHKLKGTALNLRLDILAKELESFSKGDEEALGRFYDIIEKLREKLGVDVVQTLDESVLERNAMELGIDVESYKEIVDEYLISLQKVLDESDCHESTEELYKLIGAGENLRLGLITTLLEGILECQEKKEYFLKQLKELIEWYKGAS